MYQFDREAYEKRMRWFREARFGLFLHWGLYAIPARGEWVRSNERMPEGQYLPYFDEFTADSFDPIAWARAAKEAGMRYAVLTAPEDVLRRRLLQRGDPHLTDRALFLRGKLLAMPENQGRIIDGTLAQPELLRSLRALPELLHCDIDTTAANGVS